MRGKGQKKKNGEKTGRGELGNRGNKREGKKRKGLTVYWIPICFILVYNCRLTVRNERICYMLCCVISSACLQPVKYPSRRRFVQKFPSRNTRTHRADFSTWFTHESGRHCFRLFLGTLYIVLPIIRATQWRHHTANTRLNIPHMAGHSALL